MYKVPETILKDCKELLKRLSEIIEDEHLPYQNLFNNTDDLIKLLEENYNI